MVAQTSWESLRAVALAKVFLTRAQDLDVIDVPVNSSDAGYDFLVRAKNGKTVGAPIFAVEIKAVKDRASHGRMAFQFKELRQNLESLDLPLLLLIVELQSEEGYYVWLVEPQVDPSGRAELVKRHDLATLSVRHSALKRLDEEALKQLAEQALAWQEARDRRLDLDFRLGPFYETHGPEIIPIGGEAMMEPFGALMGTYTVHSELAEFSERRVTLGHYDLTMFIQEDWDRMMEGEPSRQFLLASRGSAHAAGRLAEEVVLRKLLTNEQVFGSLITEVMEFRTAKEQGLVQGVTKGTRSDDLILVLDDDRLAALESKASFRRSGYLQASSAKIEAQLRALLRANPGIVLVFAARVSLIQHTIELAGAMRDNFLTNGLRWPPIGKG